jgi:serine/threonine-protein kinase HipA
VIEQVAAQLPDGFPAKVSDRIFDGLRKTVAALEAMPDK